MQRCWIASAFVLVMATLIGSPAHAQLARARGFLSEGETIPGLRGFSVVLVQGDLKPGAAQGESVPPAAAKALADLKDFLPYKSYRLLDTQWTMGSGHMTGRLLGPDGKSYDLELQTKRGSGSDSPVMVSRFLLREVGGAGTFGDNNRFGSLHQKGLISSEALSQSRGALALVLPRGLIDTSFSMDIGETVVVGTSRLQGDTALIVLLTAVSRSASPQRAGRGLPR